MVEATSSVQPRRHPAWYGVLDEVLAQGAKLLSLADTNNDTNEATISMETLGLNDATISQTWATKMELQGCLATPCRSSVLMNTRRGTELHASVFLLLTPWGSHPALPKGLRLGSTKFCHNAISCEPEFATPLDLCAATVSSQVAIAAELAEGEEPHTLAFRVDEETVIAIPFSVMTTTLGRHHIELDVLPVLAGVPGKAGGKGPGNTATAPSVTITDFSGNLRWLEDASDPLVHDFCNLKEQSTKQDASAGATFIVEGPEAIRVLLASDFVVDKLFLKASLHSSLHDSLDARRQRFSNSGHPDGEEIQVILCEAAMMESVTGISAKHASAALALARRKASLDPEFMTLGRGDRPFRALALEDALDEEGVGALFRVAAGFGVDVILLAQGCGDPFHRRAVRVSMGHVLRVPFVRGHLPDLISQLSLQGVLTIACAAVTQGGRFLDELDTVPRRWACVVGAEGPVASPEVLAVCKHRLAIRTALPEVSLGTGVATSVLLNGCAERESQQAMPQGD